MNVVEAIKNTSKGKWFSIELNTNYTYDFEKLKSISPTFISIPWFYQTCAKSVLFAKELTWHGFTVLLHIAARNLDRDEATDLLNGLKNDNIRNIFVVKGQSGVGEDKNHFPHASDFIEFARVMHGDYFCIGAAASKPVTSGDEIMYLKYKVSAGAEFIISQMLFDFEHFDAFYRSCREEGISVPILPGFYLISSYERLLAITQFCKVNVPESIMMDIRTNRNNNKVIQDLGIDVFRNFLKRSSVTNSNSVAGIHIFSIESYELLKKALKYLE